LSAAEVSPLVGRSTNEVGELVATAERGLTDAFLQEYVERIPADDAMATVVPMLGGYVRSSLPPMEHRLVEEHLGRVAETGADLTAKSGHTSADSRRLISVASSLHSVLPPAIAPGVTGLSIQQLRRALGTTTRSFGADTMVAARSSRVRRAVLIGSAAAVVFALVGATIALRQPDEPFDDALASTPVPSFDAGEADVPSPTSSTTTDSTTTDSTTTTTLDLRPSGPPSEIDVVVNAGTRADGLNTLDTALVTSVAAPAPVFAGGTGTLDVSLTNPSDGPVVANLELMLPNGMLFGGLVGGDAVCVDPDDDSPYCDIVVDPGSTRDLSVLVRLESGVVGRIVVDGASIVEPLEVQIVAVSNLVHNSVGRGDVIVIGNTLLACADEAAARLSVSCAEVRAGTGDVVDRWNVPMENLGNLPAFGFSNSSRAVLDLPDGASVRAAYLFWAGDVLEGDQSVSPDGQSKATLVTPTGEVANMQAQEIIFGQQDSSQYLGRVDVTAAVAAGGAGEYLVGNVASVQTRGSFGGWSLVVVTDDANLPRRERLVLDPFAWVAPEATFEFGVGIPTPVLAGATAQLDILGFEGERGLGGEVLSVGGVSVAGDNPFDSSITGVRTPSFDNNLGVDIDAYDLMIDTPAGSLSINATSSGDGIRLAVLGFTVDIAP
jgi:hypothetical protein